MSKVRNAAVAGYFYPAGKNELTEMIENFLSKAEESKQLDDIAGIISPHAGYQFSGLTAAYAYRQLKNKNIKTAVVLSPSHREYFDGVSIYDGDAYSTPLGDLEIDSAVADKLCEGGEIFRGSEGHGNEHALEVQLPFLQRVLNDFKIVPVVMGNQNTEYISVLADKLSEIISPDVIIVASSDLSHFHSKLDADDLDSIIAEHIDKFEADELETDLMKKNAEACGGGLIVAMMKAAKKAGYQKASVLHRSDSGDTTGDTDEVVGYLSAAVHK